MGLVLNWSLELVVYVTELYCTKVQNEIKTRLLNEPPQLSQLIVEPLDLNHNLSWLDHTGNPLVRKIVQLIVIMKIEGCKHLITMLLQPHYRYQQPFQIISKPTGVILVLGPIS